MSFLRRFFSGTAVTQITMDAAKQKAQTMIDENAVMVFSKSYCPYCRNSKRILDGYGAKYNHYELNEESDGDDIQAALQQMTGQRTVPNIFIGKKHIGGNSDLEKIKPQDLESMLRDVHAIA